MPVDHPRRVALDGNTQHRLCRNSFEEVFPWNYGYIELIACCCCCYWLQYDFIGKNLQIMALIFVTFILIFRSEKCANLLMVCCCKLLCLNLLTKISLCITEIMREWWLFPEHGEPVMKYMGDQPTKQSRIGNELTDDIFEPALKHVCNLGYFLDHIHSPELSSRQTFLFCRLFEDNLGGLTLHDSSYMSVMCCNDCLWSLYLLNTSSVAVVCSEAVLWL